MEYMTQDEEMSMDKHTHRQQRWDRKWDNKNGTEGWDNEDGTWWDRVGHQQPGGVPEAQGVLVKDSDTKLHTTRVVDKHQVQMRQGDRCLLMEYATW